MAEQQGGPSVHPNSSEDLPRELDFRGENARRQIYRIEYAFHETAVYDETRN